jgi:uncharacterized membrane protein YccF (DUF307 family)
VLGGVFMGTGVWLAIGHVLLAILCCTTLIGIQHLKLAGIGLAPIGKTIAPREVAAAARKQAAEAFMANMKLG